jgi:hypothetical protein
VPDFAALRSSHFGDPSIKLRVVRGLSVDCGLWNKSPFRSIAGSALQHAWQYCAVAEDCE